MFVSWHDNWPCTAIVVWQLTRPAYSGERVAVVNIETSVIIERPQRIISKVNLKSGRQTCSDINSREKLYILLINEQVAMKCAFCSKAILWQQ